MAINVGELFAILGLRDEMSGPLRRAIRNLRRAAGESNLHAADMARAAERSLQAFARLTAQVGAVAAGLSLLSASVAGAAHAVVSLGAALAPAVGALAALPGVAALGGAAMATLAVALVGVGDAFEAALGDDEEKFEEALERLAPAAQAAARELRELRPTLDLFRKGIQDALFTPLVGQLSAVAQVLHGPLYGGMHQVASAIGLAAARVAEFARSGLALTAVATVFGSLRTIVAELSRAVEPLLAGFTKLAIVGAQFTGSFGPAMADLMARFGQWLSAIADSGQAWAWMQGAVEVFRQLGQVAADVWRILSGVFSAMRAAGGDALGVLGTIVRTVADWVNSAQGQQTLVNIFVALRTVAQALAPVIAAIAVGIGQLAPLLGQLAMIVGPVLTAAIAALVPALASLAPGLFALFQAVGAAVAQLAPALVPAAQAFSAMVVALSPLLPLLGQLVAVVATSLAGGLVAILPSINLLVWAFGQAVVAVAPLIPALIALAAQVINVAVAGIGPLLPELLHLVRVFGADLLAALVRLAPHLVGLIRAFTDLLPSLLPLLPPLIQLVIGLLPPLIHLVDVIARLLRGDFLGAMDAAGRAVVGFLRVIGGLGWELLTGLWNGIEAAGRWFRDVIYGFFRNIMPDWVRQALGISSPSRVFAQIGANTMLGMRDGMLDTSRQVLSAAAGIADRLSASFAPDLTADMRSTGQRVTGSGRGGTTVIHVTAINPQAEPTSDTINRGLAFAGMLGVV